MNLVLARHLWGVDPAIPLKTLLPRWRETGYSAVEASYAFLPGRERSLEHMAAHGWGWIAQVSTNAIDRDGSYRPIYTPDISSHLDSLRWQVEQALAYGPLFINAQSGYDGWSHAQAEEFYGRALEMECELGAVIAHETHRQRYFATPWATLPILRQFPALKLTCDFSHWVCVTERLLPDCADAVSEAARHCLHVHARVGFEEGPQVPDPRVPAYRPHLEAHEVWWREIWSAQAERGCTVSTLTPEFGPPTYQHTDPATGLPLADLAEICDWMARRCRDSFSKNQPPQSG